MNNTQDRINEYKRKLETLQKEKQQTEVELQVLEKELAQAKDKLKELGVNIDESDPQELVAKINKSIDDLESKIND